MSRTVTLARRHWAIAALVALAAAIRVLVMLAYQPAFWFYGDSGSYITSSLKAGLNPYDSNGLGYGVVLKIFKVTGTFTAVVVAQHITGLLIASAVYAVLHHRGLPRWLACLAATPVLFDSLQITLEHYLLGETLFTALAVTGVFLLLWPRQPSVMACLASGFLIMLAWFTRPSTVPVAIVLVCYLIVRRAGWRKVVAFAVAFLIPYLAVIAWIGDRPSAYGSSFANRALYSRVAAFVDCDRLDLTEAEQRLCPWEPLGQRHDRPDWYGWNGPARQIPKDDNAILRVFALKAIARQPADYSRTVLRDLAPHFIPGRFLSPEQACLREKWSLPDTIRDTPVETACTPALAQRDWAIKPADPATTPAPTGLTRALRDYSEVMRMAPLLLTTAVVLSLLAVFTLRRMDRDAHDAVMLTIVAGSLVVPPVLVAMYEARYGLPALPFTGVAAALAIHYLAGVWRARGRPQESNMVEAPAGPPVPTSSLAM